MPEGISEQDEWAGERKERKAFQADEVDLSWPEVLEKLHVVYLAIIHLLFLAWSK